MELMLNKPDDNENLTTHIYTSLKESILTLKILPGKKTSEMKIAKMMNCSRAPVRDAFRQLCHEGFLEVRPQVGTFVAKINMKLSEQARFVRESLELSVLKIGLHEGCFEQHIAALQQLIDSQRITYEQKNYDQLHNLDLNFHALFCHAAGKEFINTFFLAGIDVHYSRLRFLALRYDLHPMILIKQHQDILDAIKNNDEAMLEKAVSSHCNNLYRVIHECGTMVEPYIT